MEIRKKVTEKLSRYIQNPQLEVRIAAYRSKKINVTGQVNQPGTFPITDVPMTLVEALNMAGGFTDTAAPQQVRVVRGEQRMTFDVQGLLERGDLSQNILLQDGDAVYVPDNSFYAVHMLGSVKKPGAVPMSRGRLEPGRSDHQQRRLRRDHFQPGPDIRVPRALQRPAGVLAGCEVTRRHAAGHAVCHAAAGRGVRSDHGAGGLEPGGGR